MEYGEALIRSLERQRNDSLNVSAQLMARVEMLEAKLRELMEPQEAPAAESEPAEKA